MNAQHVLIITSLLCLAAAPSAPGALRFGKSVYRMNQLDAAKEEAKSKNEAIAFLYTDEDTKDGTCEAASMDAINGMKSKSTIVYVNSNGEMPLLPTLVQDALKAPEAGQTTPITVVVDPDITQVIAIVPYESEQAHKNNITKAKKLISKALPDQPSSAATPEATPAAAPSASTEESAEKNVHEPRTWTSVGGTALEASFEGIRGDVVSLRRTDGTLMSIPIDRLSAEDQTFIRQLSSAAP